jgi:hypothetical protein
MQRGIRPWFEETREVYRENPKSGLLHGLYYTYVGLWLTLTSRWPVGTHVFERDWDALIVLDTCRVDALQAVADEYDFVGDVNAITSVGSTSGEWVAHTFDESHRESVERTAYVTANPHSDTVLRSRNTPPQFFPAPLTWPAWNPVEPDALGHLAEVWRQEHDDRLGVTPPDVTTDWAIDVGRSTDTDRLIVHYMQPHEPYIADHVGNDSNGERGGEGDLPPERVESLPPERAEPINHLQRGDLSQGEVREAYLDNLRLVLDEVEELLANLDAETVVLTADHGEAFGEWGFYEHPVGCPHPAVKRVPWVETTAVDTGRRQPEDVAESESESAAASVEEQLSALGYQ